MNGDEIAILVGNYFDFKMLKYVPDILENNHAQEIIKELVSKFPEMKIIGEIPEQLSELRQANDADQDNVRRIRHHK